MRTPTEPPTVFALPKPLSLCPKSTGAHIICSASELAAANDPTTAPSAHATILRTNNGSSCRWLRMIPSGDARLRFSALDYDFVR